MMNEFTQGKTAGQSDGARQAQDLHEIACEHDATDADRTNGEIHATCREHHHRREADDRVDCKRPGHGEEVERRDEAGRQTGEDDPKKKDDPREPNGIRLLREPRLKPEGRPHVD
jgi:hypothetical protein